MPHIRDTAATRPTPDRSEARERIAALAYRFWSIHPSEISAKNITREQFYAREITALINNLVQDERAAVAAWMIQHGHVTGHGDTLDDLLGELEASIRADEREKCAAIADTHETTSHFGIVAKRAIAGKIRSNGGQK